ncbi:MAG TPA: prepilin-type N-terminal cleavage/methylation domain-containing protein [Stenotrophomonas sp.]|nr:prepilin-type N-terminal cleavage/methylation domain-containing protein [Stenotrophomonas sp.]
MPSCIASPRRVRGFTIVEMSVVLVIVALLLGAVAVGRDVFRSAAAERFSNDYVQAWVLAYDRYVAGTGGVPGDNFDTPTGYVNASSGSFLCGNDLLNALLQRGIEVPAGRGEGLGDRFVLQDSRGQPHEVRVCFGNVPWAEPYGSVGTYTTRPRNVMRLRGLTPELATQLDTRIDGRVDARHGRVREVDQQSSTSAQALPWSLQNDDAMTGGSNDPDAQVAEVHAYLRMDQ